MTRGRGRPSSDSPFRYGTDWWRRGVVYQIYPRSFADSDGDGIGDLRGIVEHLDHLGPDGLGVDAIWLSPVYRSPGRDGGYDVSDHTAIDPLFGTEADLDDLVREAHRRGIRVILDLVLNHTSEEHPWFIESSSSRTNPRADWYVWRDPDGIDDAGRPRPPNNWVSWFGGPAWTYEPRRGQFYHHTFLPEQPEVDWRVPAVEAAQFDVIQAWLARDIDGFRLDTFNVFLKDPAMRSNPVRRGSSAWARQVHSHDIDQPDLLDLMTRLRAVVESRPDRMTVGELFVGTTEMAEALTSDRHLVFDWELMGRRWQADDIGAAVRRRERAFGRARWPTVVFSNHDQPRHASRLAATVPDGDRWWDAIARAVAVVELTLRGTPFLYYGEEIGMGDVVIPPEERVDPVADRADPGFQWWDRSQARTPLPWTDGPGAGFTAGRPWLRIGPDAATRNVARQAADPHSILSTYRRLLEVRRSQPSLQDGALTFVPSPSRDMLTFRRTGSGPEVLVLASFTADELDVDVPDTPGRPAWHRIGGTHLEGGDVVRRGDIVRLRPFEAVIAVAAP